MAARAGECPRSCQSLDRIGIDRSAAIHRAHHTADTGFAVLRHLDLGDLREIAEIASFAAVADAL